jgi:hypothetical protein
VLSAREHLVVRVGDCALLTVAALDCGAELHRSLK